MITSQRILDSSQLQCEFMNLFSRRRKFFSQSDPESVSACTSRRETESVAKLGTVTAVSEWRNISPVLWMRRARPI